MSMTFSTSSTCHQEPGFTTDTHTQRPGCPDTRRLWSLARMHPDPRSTAPAAACTVGGGWRVGLVGPTDEAASRCPSHLCSRSVARRVAISSQLNTPLLENGVPSIATARQIGCHRRNCDCPWLIADNIIATVYANPGTVRA